MSADPLHVVVLDDSPVFSVLAANAVSMCLPDANVVRCSTYDEAAPHLQSHDCALIVCGYGVGGGLTAHDVRRVSAAPMVLFTGRPVEELDLPVNSRLVMKEAGPGMLRAAIGAAVAG